MQSPSSAAGSSSSVLLGHAVPCCCLWPWGKSSSLGSGAAPLASPALLTGTSGSVLFIWDLLPFSLLQTVPAWPRVTAALATLGAVTSMDNRHGLVSSWALVLNRNVFQTSQIYKALATSHSAVRCQRRFCILFIF